MSEELKIIQNEDGTFSEYDDTFDITIHCHSEEEQNEVLAKLNAQKPCEDCISREKALQIIRAWFDREATPSDLKNEIEQLPSVTPQLNKWIPVETALPEVGIDVLMCDMEGTIYLSHRSSYGSYFDEWGNKIKNIRAWMPLPTPPNKSEIQTGAEGSEE